MKEEPKRPREEDEPEDLLYGRNPVWALLESQPRRCLKVWLAKGTREPFRGRLTDRCRSEGIPLQEVDSKALERMLPGRVHQGVAARTTGAELLEISQVLDLLPPPPAPALVVVLDHLEDPHNAGAILRTAEAVGAGGAFLPLRRGALPTGAMVKASVGAALRLPLGRLGNVGQDLRLLQEAGLPLWQRAMLPLLWSDDRLVWVAGIGCDAAVRAAPGEAGWLPDWLASQRPAPPAGGKADHHFP